MKYKDSKYKSSPTKFYTIYFYYVIISFERTNNLVF